MSVLELRVALTVDDLDAALRLYRDALGLDVVMEWAEATGRGVVLAAGQATLELIDRDQADHIDRVEVGRRVSGPVRLALEVEDVVVTGDRLASAGAAPLVDAPVDTPWGDRNLRLRAPDGMQLTLFESPHEEIDAG